MNDFLQDLFQASGKNRPELLADYDDEDLANFFDRPVDDPKACLLTLAAVVLDSLDDHSAVNESVRKSGLADKSVEKVIGYVKKNRGELSSLKIRRHLGTEETLEKFEWSVRSVFFSKKDEFKGQKKYAVLNFDVESKDNKEKIKVNCSKENIAKIRDKLNLLDENIREIFESN